MFKVIHYYLHMYLKTLGINALNLIYELDPAHFLSATELATNREGICHAIHRPAKSIHRHAKSNNKYMKKYDKNKKSSYNQYLDANNLYGWAMSQKLLVDSFRWKKILLNLMKSL